MTAKQLDKVKISNKIKRVWKKLIEYADKPANLQIELTDLDRANGDVKLCFELLYKHIRNLAYLRSIALKTRALEVSELIIHENMSEHPLEFKRNLVHLDEDLLNHITKHLGELEVHHLITYWEELHRLSAQALKSLEELATIEEEDNE